MTEPRRRRPLRLGGTPDFAEQVAVRLAEHSSELEIDLAKVWACASAEGRLNSGRTIIEGVSAAAKRFEAMTVVLLNDFEHVRARTRSDVQMLEEVRGAVIQLGLRAREQCRLPRGGAPRLSTGLVGERMLAEGIERALDLVRQHAEGYPIEGVAKLAEPPVRELPLFPWLERFPRTNPALVAVLSFLAGVAVTAVVLLVGGSP